MEIYIQNSEGYWANQRFEILPSNTPTLDETLETFSFALISNNNPLPYAPMQKVRVYFDNTSDYTDFYIVSDSVETYSLNPLRYKHSISCIQNTRVLSKHLVRNSVFSQPAYLYKKSYNATSQGAFQNASQGGASAWHNAYTSPSNPNLISKPLHLTSKEKIKNAYFKLSFQFGYGQYSVGTDDLCVDAHNKNDILAVATSMTSITIDNTLTLRYKDANNQTQTRPINASYFNLSEFDLNGTYQFPLVKELADLGCNDFELLFNTRLFLDGTYSVDDVRVLFWFAQLEIKAETYYWSCYDVLNLLIERQKKETSINSPTPLFSLPQSGELYDLLKNTIAPNFTFTQLTMYECVAEVFRLFDAIFTMDENGVLGIEYFNNLSNDYVEKDKFTGRTLALGEDKYTNGLVAHYQDARLEETFPRNNGFANLRSAEFGVPEAQDHNFIVPHNIQSIVKLEILLEGLDVKFSDGADSGFHVRTSLALDITDFVFDESIWSTLDTGAMQDSDYDSYLVKQANSVYFTQGDNKIKIAATFKDSWQLTHYTLAEIVEMAILKLAGVYTAIASAKPKDVFYPNPNIYDGDWKNIKMRLTYIASVDGKTETHSITNKYNGETLIDQNNGAVDLNKMGLNMLGLSLKLGNPTLNATHKISKWSDRIKTGQLYEYEGATWVANVVNYTFFNGGVQGKVSFVQNFNALALRTQLLREKRFSNISKELTQKSEEVLTDFIYFSSEGIDQEGETIHFNDQYWGAFIRDSFDIEGPYSILPDAFLCDSSEVDGSNNVTSIYIPTIRYGSGNTINIEMGFDHPLSAGIRTKVAATTWYGSNKYFTDNVVYTTNEEGKMVIYTSTNDSRFSEGFLDVVSVKIPTQTVNYTSDFPIATINVANCLLDIEDYKVYKQPNEIFALNYQLAFLPIPGRENIDFLGNEWINNNCFVKNFEESKKTRYIAFMSEKSSNLDVKATDYFLKQEITRVSLSSTFALTKHTILLYFSGLTYDQIQQTKSWAIVDERDNILFASNSKLEYSNRVDITFVSYKNRLS